MGEMLTRLVIGVRVEKLERFPMRGNSGPRRRRDFERLCYRYILIQPLEGDSSMTVRVVLDNDVPDIEFWLVELVRILGGAGGISTWRSRCIGRLWPRILLVSGKLLGKSKNRRAKKN